MSTARGREERHFEATKPAPPFLHPCRGAGWRVRSPAGGGDIGYAHAQLFALWGHFFAFTCHSGGAERPVPATPSARRPNFPEIHLGRVPGRARPGWEGPVHYPRGVDARAAAANLSPRCAHSGLAVRRRGPVTQSSFGLGGAQPPLPPIYIQLRMFLGSYLVAGRPGERKSNQLSH